MSTTESRMGKFSAACFTRYFTVGVLTGINLLNYMDRYTLAGILTELENKTRNGFSIDNHEEAIGDGLGGLLQTAFIVSYMILSPLFGYLGDRYTRKYIITVGILIWSAFTLTGSFSVACKGLPPSQWLSITFSTEPLSLYHTECNGRLGKNYWMLFGTRLLVGVGEASYATIAPTMIADLFPTKKRLRMLSIFYIAMPLGSALGYIIGSEVSALVYDFAHVNDSWRWALRITPGLGVIAALLVFFVVKEPARGHGDGQRSRSSTGVRGKSGFMAYMHDVWYCLRVKTFVFSTLGFAAVAYTTGALAQWAPAFVQRASRVIMPDHPYSTSDAAIRFGAVTVIAGILGTVSGSELAKFLGKYTRKADALVCSLGMMVGTPFLFLGLTVVQYQQIYVAWVMVFFAEFFLCLNWAPVAAMLLYTIIPERRSTAEAVQILISHLLGDAISPAIVGGISDAIYSRIKFVHTEYAGRAISTEFALFTTAIVCVLGGSAFLASSLTVEADRKAVEQYTAMHNAKIQRNDDDKSSDEFDEHKGLIGEAMNEQMAT